MTAPEDLERAILGAVPELTGEEVAETAGLTVEQAQRLWRALGFPGADGASAFSTADAEALSRVAAIERLGHLDFDTIVRMTRAVGQTMDRLAEWEVATLASLLDKTKGDSSKREEALRLVEGIGPDFEALLTYVWRRHLVAAVARVESLEGAADEQLAEATVGFRRPGQLQRAHQPARRRRDRRPGRGLREPQPRRRLPQGRPGGQDAR